MENIIKAIAELIPFSSLFEKIGFSEKASAGLSVLAIALLVFGIYSLYKYLVNHYKNSKAAKDLAPWFEYQQLKGARKMFISTQFQNQSPTREEEPGFSHKFVSKSSLIPFFIKTAFDEKKESNKFYLILADSGMGKTTFMLNLYVQYHSFFNFGRKYKMRLYPFGDERIIDMIKKIDTEEAKDTILLLDAFDEDKKLLKLEATEELTAEERFRKRMDEIIDAVRDFREVIITSRTQYFPGQEKEDYELKIPRFDGKGFHTLAKMYLSPFDPKEVNRYLNKKYGRLRFWNRKKKQLATNIIHNSPKLMVRPMLLSYVDLLVEGKKEFKNTYEIYETLIEKWIEREADKRKRHSERDVFKYNLHQYSKLVALEIYEERKNSNMFHLTKERALEVARNHEIELKNYEITGQSLLTRDAEGNWKFAHKSILEYFIAKEAIENFEFTEQVDFTGIDMAKQFYDEVIPDGFVFVKGGIFVMGSNKKEDPYTMRPAHEVKLADYYIAKYPVTQKQWKVVMDIEPSQFRGDEFPMGWISWGEVQQFIKKLNKKTNESYRLPTEAEWEYAARGGNKSKGYKYAGSDDLDEVGWYVENSSEKPRPVGQKKPNELGVYDMSGNVSEWCEDHHDERYYEDCKKKGIVNNPRATKTSSDRIRRGGGFKSYSDSCSTSYREYMHRVNRDTFIGFRLVRNIEKDNTFYSFLK